ncbi:cytochrome P450 [Nostoc sp. MS1]|uniref:cytochrome P450 n=1 Tax=Nostoc sp. MS1 TaxID=2764711 RepID=UPI001CC370BE|nr:cytochrome P450 [Nostoc sp. MS1]BCL37434.1 hypothetical protein NSMS1_38810 [Nostoc sp. MS1]
MKLPDSPQIPKFMQLLQWIYQPLQLMEASAKAHGDFFTLWLTNKQPMVFLSNPQAVQQLFSLPLEQLDAKASAQILQPLLGENSLLLLSGETHQRQRKLLTPPFHGDRMRAYGDIITNITKEVIRPDLYPQPQEFNPERFLEKQYSLYEYLPFGGSNRRCVGMAFALYEMKLVLATVLKNLDLALVDNYPVKPIRRGVTLAPSGGKWLIATAQHQTTKNPIEV